jgi:D-alanyl-D-alanine carboxypeptidase
VNTLTGYVVTADGQPLVFALMTSGGAGQTSARAWLDRASSALALLRMLSRTVARRAPQGAPRLDA